ncbi:MAG: hypothetical protein AAFQ41_09755 [Cyanobacteria bacterium J06623_7]
MHDTYDQFLGSWWGGIIAQNCGSQLVKSFPADLMAQPWLQRRTKIGQMLLDGEPSSDLLQLISRPEPSRNIQGKQQYEQYNSDLLSLLPLIIFDGNCQNFCLQSADKRNLKLVNLIQDGYLSPNILLWIYLLTTVLDRRVDLASQRITKAKIFHQSPAKASLLANQLELVERAIDHGETLELLSSKLLATKDCSSTAIALSWYCFISTPRNPKLSIFRAARVEPRLAWLTTALTGTLSGAYNGMTRISVSWRNYSQPKTYHHREDSLFSKLFTSWLGMYHPHGNITSWSLGGNAIAPAPSIQLRPHLSIISQQSLNLPNH